MNPMLRLILQIFSFVAFIVTAFSAFASGSVTSTPAHFSLKFSQKR